MPKPGQELPAPYRYLSPHTSLPVRTPWEGLSPTLGFLVYHRFKGWSREGSKATSSYLVAWPDLLESDLLLLTNAHLCFNCRGCREREREKCLTGCRARSKGKSTVSSPCNKECPESGNKLREWRTFCVFFQDSMEVKEHRHTLKNYQEGCRWGDLNNSFLE